MSYNSEHMLQDSLHFSLLWGILYMIPLVNLSGDQAQFSRGTYIFTVFILYGFHTILSMTIAREMFITNTIREWKYIVAVQGFASWVSLVPFFILSVFGLYSPNIPSDVIWFLIVIHVVIFAYAHKKYNFLLTRN